MPRRKTKIDRSGQPPWGAFVFWRGMNARIRTIYQGLVVLDSVAFTSEPLRLELAHFETGEFLVLPSFEFRAARHWR